LISYFFRKGFVISPKTNKEFF